MKKLKIYKGVLPNSGKKDASFYSSSYESPHYNYIFNIVISHY